MNPDDPKFTAHALGELEDLTPAERAEIEALLASDPMVVAEANEVQALAARLRAELPGEEAAALHAEQRAAVLSAVTDVVPAAKIVRFPRRAVMLSAIAACVVVGLSIALLFPVMQAERAALQRSLAAHSPESVGQRQDNLRGLLADSSNQPLTAPPMKLGAAALAMDGTVEGQKAFGVSAGEPVLEKRGGGLLSLGQTTIADPQATIHRTMDEKLRADFKTSQPTAPGAPEIVVADAGSAKGLSKDVATKISGFTSGWAKSGTASFSNPRKNLDGSDSPEGERLARATPAAAALMTAGTFSGALQPAATPASNMAANGPQQNAERAKLTAQAGAIHSFEVAGANTYTGTSSLSGGTMPIDGSKVATLGDSVANGSRLASVDKLMEGRDDRREPAKAYYFREQKEEASTEAFDAITDNAFLTARESPLSTFSIDVDTASYSIVRRFLNNNQRPPKGAVRIEELLNYFTYDYPQPNGDAPFSASMEVTACPWTPEHRLVRIGLKGREIARDKRPASNLVFLIDVSGSMQPENKLPLLKQSLALLIDQLGGEDQVAIVVYAGSSGCVLEPTRDQRKMHAALRKLEAGGSTNGASGLQLAYQLAEKKFIKGGTNRVILATDGDWNVGVTNQRDLLDLIKRKAKSGVFLTVLGVGMDNLKDTMLVKLADTGNGNYAYLDTLLEAKKVLVEQLSGTLVTIAKDVKIQVEFNPTQVGAYRLIGYEKRMLAKEDFNNDKKDAGEIGAGHTVTALYEVVPAGQQLFAMQKTVDALKYQPDPAAPTTPPGAPMPNLPKSQPERAPADARPYLLEEKPKAEPEDATIRVVPADKPATPERELERVAEKAKANVADGLPAAVRNELLTLKLRYKEPEGDTSKLLEFPLTDRGTPWEQSSRDFRFAAAVAGYGMLLRDSPHKGQATWGGVAEWAQEGKGTDASGYRAEFLALLEKAKALTR